MMDEGPTAVYEDGNPLPDRVARAESELRTKIHGENAEVEGLEWSNDKSP